MNGDYIWSVAIVFGDIDHRACVTQLKSQGADSYLPTARLRHLMTQDTWQTF